MSGGIAREQPQPAQVVERPVTLLFREVPETSRLRHGQSKPGHLLELGVDEAHDVGESRRNVSERCCHTTEISNAVASSVRPCKAAFLAINAHIEREYRPPDEGFSPAIASEAQPERLISRVTRVAQLLHRRDHMSTTIQSVSSSLHPFFAPLSIAVVGAGRTRGGIGAEIFNNLVTGGFTGDVFAVNPHGHTIDGRPAWPTVSAIPWPVDLAVVAVPCDKVEAVVDDCIAAHVPAIVVISAGFAETGKAGRAREAAIRDKVRRAGIRMIGPNCMGVLNADPAVRMNATFAPAFPPGGNIGFSSQSGALGLAILEGAKQLNLGISTFASIGNKADVSTNDLLEYWETDPKTDVILLYVESFGNPRRFGQIARRVGRRKPIAVVKSGRSRSGARAASSHTGALAASDTAVEALFRDAGVIRTDTVEELFHVGALLAHQPLPKGPRVAILTNAGGPGILAADACEARGLTLATLSNPTIAGLASFLPQAASIGNPVDMLATAPAEHYEKALPLLLNDPGVDSVLVIFIPPLVTQADDVARAIKTAARGSSKPVLANFFGAAGVPEALAPVPSYAFPESAAAALARVVEYARWRERPAGQIPELADVDRDRARRIVERTHNTGGGWLDPLAAFELLQACGVRTAPIRTVVTVEGALAAAREVGYPVVLKGAGPNLLHKTESGAVFTNIGSEDSLCRAFHALSRRPDVTQVIVQHQVSGGVEMFVGGLLDPQFGHMVMCGAGGTMLELLRDTACRLTPVTDRGAGEMIEELRAKALLRGYRGRPAVDEAAYRDTLLRVSRLLELCPEIEELDLNPVIVTPDGAYTVDVRVRVKPQVTAEAQKKV
jgi:acetyl coenzyme A synthetase (ADP forming)-like protein